VGTIMMKKIGRRGDEKMMKRWKHDISQHMYQYIFRTYDKMKRESKDEKDDKKRRKRGQKDEMMMKRWKDGAWLNIDDYDLQCKYI